MHYRILGPLEVTNGPDRVEPTALKQRTLLLCLLVHKNETVSIDRLVETIWPGGAPATALKTLQLYVSQLRKRIGSTNLKTRPAGYVLEVGDDDLDAALFERMWHDGRAALDAGNAQLAAVLLGRALGLWRGPAFADVAYSDFAGSEARRLDELRLSCLEERLTADLALGRQDEVLGELAALAERHPSRERVRALLMLALYRSGRQAEALAEYRAARRALRDELGLEPGPELTHLHRAMLRQEAHLAAPATSVESRRSLPSPPNPLIGREEELRTLRAWLDDPHVRQITLTGAGGSGKTRLALAFAHECQSLFANGAAFVELAQIADPARVVGAIAEASRFPGSMSASLPALVEWLSEQELLLVVDNFEHLLGAGGELARLVAGAPRLKLLVTSRAVLHISGEHVFPVEPLAEPAAIELFVARVHALDPRFVFDDAAQPTLGEICRRLDCLPLALELAAAQGRTLTPRQLLAQLRADVVAVAGGARDLPARQQTLRDTLAWSTDLLHDDARDTLAALGVFVGGFTLAAAEAVASATLEHVAALVDNSLLVRVEAISSGRFTMLETVREHALQLLGANNRPRIDERHATYFLSVAENAYERFAGPEQTNVMALLDDDQANLDAALETFHGTASAEQELRLATALWPYWRVRGRTAEGRAHLEEALSTGTDADELRRLPALHGAAVLADSQGDYEASTRLARESATLARALGEHAFEAKAYTILSSAATERGDLDKAATMVLRAVELQADERHARDRAFTLINLGNVELNRKRFNECERLSRESVELFRQLDDPLQAATPLFNIGLAALEQGDIDKAESHLWESFSLTCQLGHVEFIANGLDALAAIHTERGAYDRAITELAAAAALRREAGVEAQRFEAALHNRITTKLVALTGNERFRHLAAPADEAPWGIVADALGDTPRDVLER